MTWTAAVMSDDHLDPNSLVGRLLNPLTDEDDLAGFSKEH
jgi:hypothetical protein